MAVTMKYKDTDGAWKDYHVPSQITDAELVTRIAALEANIAELEEIYQGLQTYAEAVG